MKNYSLIIFDLDDTLAESKSAIQKDMAQSLKNLLDVTKVAIISGGKYEQFVKQVLSNLLPESNLENLYLFPTCGSSYYHYENGVWKNVYEERLSQDDVSKIILALQEGQKESWVITEEPFYGQQIEDRGTQVSWSALWQECPVSVKSTWDPDRKKRLHMLPFVQKRIPEFEARVWWATTIDITRKWIDKKYGIYQMEKYLWVPLSDMLFVGDAIFPWWNDYACVEVGIDYEKTTGPHMTIGIINTLVNPN